MKCNAIGPRGGICRRLAQMANGWALDFCQAHNQMVRDGKVIQCGKCGGPAGEPPPTEPECPWCGKDCPDASKPQGCWYMDCPDEPHAN